MLIQASSGEFFATSFVERRLLPRGKSIMILPLSYIVISLIGIVCVAITNGKTRRFIISVEFTINEIPLNRAF